MTAMSKSIFDILNDLIVNGNRKGRFPVSPDDFQRITDDLWDRYAALLEKSGRPIVKPNLSQSDIPYGSLEIVPDPSVTTSLYASRP